MVDIVGGLLFHGTYIYIWRFPKMAYLQIIDFKRIFHFEPSILGYPILETHHIHTYIYICIYIYTYILYIYPHTHICIYIYTYPSTISQVQVTEHAGHSGLMGMYDICPCHLRFPMGSFPYSRWNTQQWADESRKPLPLPFVAPGFELGWAGN